MNKRDTKVDILRFIAMLGIIFAHSDPPDTLFQIRIFDVVLMTFLLGLSFNLSTSNEDFKYKNYVLKRFKRLIVPTLIFLVSFFILFFVISLIRNEHYYFSRSFIFDSFSFTGGMGYVWIMMIFFTVSSLNPFTVKISNRIEKNWQYFALLMLIYAGYLVLVFLGKSMSGHIAIYFKVYVLYGIAYSLISFFSLRTFKLNKKELNILCILFFSIYMFIAIINGFKPLSTAKYPPNLYYLSYGLFACLFLYQLFDYKPLKEIFTNNYVLFISKNTEKIYFWHIIMIYVIKIFGNEMPFITSKTITRFLFYFIPPIIFTYIQLKITDKPKYKSISI
jgi:peptidoglycan/LPS O-acetylase OafA/YrhL